MHRGEKLPNVKCMFIIGMSLVCGVYGNKLRLTILYCGSSKLECVLAI